jgi:hypothetical protein
MLCLNVCVCVCVCVCVLAGGVYNVEVLCHCKEGLNQFFDTMTFSSPWNMSVCLFICVRVFVFV